MIGRESRGCGSSSVEIHFTFVLLFLQGPGQPNLGLEVSFRSTGKHAQADDVDPTVMHTVSKYCRERRLHVK